jgi:simple sugar transport system ATP-binding protein
VIPPTADTVASSVPRLSLRGIVKHYPGCRANDGIDLAVMPGECHALLGENGAGKSTLVKIVYGVLQADSGEIEWEGRPVRIDGPAAARALGIGMVFQHFSLFDSMTVAENVALGTGWSGPMADLAARIAEVSARYGLALDPERRVCDLSVGERQRVEIVRCLLQDPKLLIMDEPTSVLTPQEAEALFAVLRRLTAEGRSILYISHKLAEIRTLCERATVLRGGRVAGACDPRVETAASLARMMIGADLAPPVREAAPRVGEPRLVVERLSLAPETPTATALDAIGFTVSAGEILGIAGVAGNGQAELLAALSGETPVAVAEAIRIDGVAVGHLGPRRRRALGLGFVPEERLGRGAVPDMSLADNVLLSAHREEGMVRGGLIRFGQARRFAERVIEAFHVAATGPRAAARSLSGGNLQKFIVGREILQNPRLLVVGQPTWGGDAGAAAAIHRDLIALADAGAAILVVSQDLDELFAICDRIAVLCHGRLSPARPVRAATVEEIGLLMGGVFHLEEAAHAP